MPYAFHIGAFHIGAFRNRGYRNSACRNRIYRTRPIEAGSLPADSRPATPLLLATELSAQLRDLVHDFGLGTDRVGVGLIVALRNDQVDQLLRQIDVGGLQRFGQPVK